MTTESGKAPGDKENGYQFVVSRAIWLMKKPPLICHGKVLKQHTSILKTLKNKESATQHLNFFKVVLHLYCQQNTITCTFKLVNVRDNKSHQI